MSDPDAYVVFGGSDLQYLRIFKTNFQHCAVFIKTDGSWVFIDPLKHYINVRITSEQMDAHIRFARSKGFRVVPCDVAAPIKWPTAPTIFTCTEVVKRIIGVRDWWIFTPYQLYKYLIKRSKYV